jgi:hypothetical protein
MQQRLLWLTGAHAVILPARWLERCEAPTADRSWLLHQFSRAAL